MVPFVQSTAVVTEILTMTCIAVERHQGLVHPFKMKWQYTNQRAFTMLGEDVQTLVNFELDGCNGLLLTGLPAYSLASSKSILHS